MADESEEEYDYVWIFNGNAWRMFPSGVFADKASADKWIAKHRLSGTLSRYPIGVGVYDLVVSKGLFRPKEERHRSPEFIGTFSSAYLEHYHYGKGVEGEPDDD